ncbi:hypothetical protein KR215_010413 [Drosophila sulfurigaster]|nr:hypothetical protein KR215_010413 [Drosophila sulfurigaster]
MDIKIEQQQQQQQQQQAELGPVSPSEVPNDPGKMFIGGLSWQTSPVEGDDDDDENVDDDDDDDDDEVGSQLTTICRKLR